MSCELTGHHYVATASTALIVTKETREQRELEGVGQFVSGNQHVVMVSRLS
jgi:hypothetical protein